MNRPQAINFDADYSKVSMMIEADYNFPLTNSDEAMIRFAKIELDRLCKRILKSNCNIKRNSVTEKDNTKLYQDFLFNDILRQSSDIGSVR